MRTPDSSPRDTGDGGFTLIETLVAMTVLVIGIFSLYSLQTTSVIYNAKASGITTSSNWASDRIEQLIALNYDHNDLLDSQNDGVGGLDKTGAAADGTATSPDGRYTISWNVADYIKPNPINPADSTLKTIRVIVQRNEFGSNQSVVFNYYKQKVF